ncbi:DDE-type integrase/transposase/recombinase [Amycolatopsis sp. DG1A-15b]|nr:DDE-type integrase/transposase/recombinase [Amycolatopsis sp. DG1A-15b]WIX93441.1 DDE-type integrase/transposase/recombinase [Amycolatopsis sp. DG1A-15b]
MRRDFTAEKPGQRLVGDITCLPTFQGWLYLATVIDLHTREVVGHAMAEHMRTDLVCDAIDLAAARRLISDNAVYHHLAHPQRGPQGRVPLLALLQPQATALHHRREHPSRNPNQPLRSNPSCLKTPCPPHRGNSNLAA